MSFLNFVIFLNNKKLWLQVKSAINKIYSTLYG